jgi:hypothetical protein
MNNDTNLKISFENYLIFPVIMIDSPPNNEEKYFQDINLYELYFYYEEFPKVL